MEAEDVSASEFKQLVATLMHVESTDNGDLGANGAHAPPELAVPQVTKDVPETATILQQPMVDELVSDLLCKIELALLVQMEEADQEAVDQEAVDQEAVDQEAVDLEAVDLEAVDLGVVDLEVAADLVDLVAKDNVLIQTLLLVVPGLRLVTAT